MSTFNKVSNQTYKVNQNATHKVNANAKSNRTFNVTPNATFNIRPNKTYDVNSNRTYNMKANGTFDVSQPFTLNGYGPEVNYSPEYNSEEKKFLNQLEILCNEIRLFIVSIYKFFCEHYEFGGYSVRKLIAQIDITAQTIINEIFLCQLAIESMREATIEESLYDDDSHEIYQPIISSYEDSQDSSNQSFRVNHNILSETQTRLKKIGFNQKHTKSLIEGLKNVEQTEKNLRSFRNMNNLQETFGLDDYN